MQQIDSTTKARDALRAALADRDRAYAARDEAKAALLRADEIVGDAARETAQRTQARDAAEAQHAAEIAGDIRRGRQPNAASPAFVSQAQHALAQAEARHRMAKTARDTLAAELQGAEQSAKQADAAVSAAAYAVIVAEARPLAAKIISAKNELLASFDALIGLGSLGLHVVGGSLEMPHDLRTAIVEAKGMEHALGYLRPHLPLNAKSPEATASLRWRDYLAALTTNSDAKLSDIAPDNTPKAPALVYDAIEASRVAAASKVGVA